MAKFLTLEEEKLLTPIEAIQYRKAKIYCNDEWANGPYGGWVRGNDILKDLGWVESDTTTEDDKKNGITKRTSFIKPERLTANQ